jgi:hypothetical protein
MELEILQISGLNHTSQIEHNLLKYSILMEVIAMNVNSDLHLESWSTTGLNFGTTFVFGVYKCKTGYLCR